ncbi:RibD domain-containing protein [Actinoplanes teichomyceticus]|uniref:RibD domain-containing protein n=1 Tax=Actinoplanes teichomyceticus TaxID=1867 RepID=A0A561VLQ8_ACTTI|nr:RibD domain-containing protein [Actinoplanes teichomyceticus]GIF13914.1 hypothetical protein Ate01nite_39460 [Actinoplanes teichomyceticus]
MGRTRHRWHRGHRRHPQRAGPGPPGGREPPGVRDQSSLAQQYLRAGQIDEIDLNVVPVLLGGGVALFGNLDKAIDLERTRVVESDGVTHVRYRVRT